MMFGASDVRNDGLLIYDAVELPASGSQLNSPVRREDETE